MLGGVDVLADGRVAFENRSKRKPGVFIALSRFVLRPDVEVDGLKVVYVFVDIRPFVGERELFGIENDILPFIVQVEPSEGTLGAESQENVVQAGPRIHQPESLVQQLVALNLVPTGFEHPGKEFSKLVRGHDLPFQHGFQWGYQGQSPDPVRADPRPRQLPSSYVADIRLVKRDGHSRQDRVLRGGGSGVGRRARRLRNGGGDGRRRRGLCGRRLRSLSRFGLGGISTAGCQNQHRQKEDPPQTLHEFSIDGP